MGKNQDPIQKIPKKQERAGGIAEIVECLKVLSSNASTARKKEKRKKEKKIIPDS
jgi:hypothetical protein